MRESVPFLNDIHDGGQVGSRNRKRSWVLYWHEIILNELVTAGHEIDSVSCGFIRLAKSSLTPHFSPDHFVVCKKVQFNLAFGLVTRRDLAH